MSLKRITIRIIVMLVIGGTVFAAGQQASGTADTSQFVEISHYVLGNPPTNDALEQAAEKWNAIMKEEINASMTFHFIEWADYLTKYNLILASGEPIDLIHTASTWLDMWTNAQRGSFRILDDLLPVYAPKTWAEIPPEDWDQARFDGKIVTVPENCYSQYVNHGMMYRGDWAREFGIGTIDSWDKLEEYFQGIVDKKPGVIPWDVAGKNHAGLIDGWVESETDAVRLDIGTGRNRLFYGKTFDDPYVLYCPIFDDDLMIEFARRMKKWYNAGFWRKDALNYSGDTRMNMRAGTSGADQHHSNTFRTHRTDMDKDQPGSETQFFGWVDVRGNLVAEPITHGGTAVANSSRNAERALMVYEMIRQNEEVYRLVNYGIEGKQYIITDGKRVRPADYNDKEHKFYSNFWGGRVDRFEIPDARDYPGIWDLWNHYAEIVRKPYPFGKFVFDKTNIEAELAAIADVVAQKGLPINFGMMDDPVAAVKDYQDSLKAVGYDKVYADIQRQLDEFKEKMM